MTERTDEHEGRATWPVAFREVDHTADLEVEWEARSREELVAAAIVMLGALCSDARPAREGGRHERFEIGGVDDEARLRGVLAHVLLSTERDGAVPFEARVVRVGGQGPGAANLGARATAGGAPPGERFAVEVWLAPGPSDGRRRDIKAVTYHHLAIEACDRGVRGRVVFDI